MSPWEGFASKNPEIHFDNIYNIYIFSSDTDTDDDTKDTNIDVDYGDDDWRLVTSI